MFLIRNATILDPDSPQHGKKLDIFIKNGVIEDIGKNLKATKATLIETDQMMVSPGWLDIGAQIGEPGYEHREDLASVSAAAAAGGYTALACFPNTAPTIHSKSEVQFLKNNSGLVQFFPIGALSKDCKGEDLAELYDMAAAGAVAFSDGKKSITSANLMKRGLEYLKGINGLLINHPNDASLSKNGQLHEGIISTQLGMQGIPSLAETLMLKRDLSLLDYTESRLHVHNISTAASVKLLKKAKAKGLQITASVPIMNLIFDDSDLLTFDTNYKVLPPLRKKTDRKALWKGLLDGTIDLINSNHVPLELEAKKLEFAYADFGAIGLETVYSLLTTYGDKKFDSEKIVELLARHPRQLLGLELPTIQKGQLANLTLFSPTKKWTYTAKDIRSKSKNSPILGKELTGKVIGTINGHYSTF